MRDLLWRSNGGLEPPESRRHCGDGFSFERHGGAPNAGVQRTPEAVRWNDLLGVLLAFASPACPHKVPSHGTKCGQRGRVIRGIARHWMAGEARDDDLRCWIDVKRLAVNPAGHE